MDKQQLMQLLPHRDPMLLLDEAELDGDLARGKRLIRGDEWFLQGHFPDHPVVPGVILCEILAQSACVLLGETESGGKTPYFTGMDKVRFKHPVRPGDTVCTTCRILRKKAAFYFAAGQLQVNDTVCVEAEFSFALV